LSFSVSELIRLAEELRLAGAQRAALGALAQAADFELEALMVELVLAEREVPAHE
jgi:hypothetical protein